MSNHSPETETAATPARPLRVVLVDDSGLSRQALAGLLDRLGGIQVAGQAENGREAFALASRLQPDLVITDLHMPDLDGLEVVRLLRTSHPAMKSLIISSHDGPSLDAISRQHGADGFITKQRLPKELPRFLARLFPGATASKTAAATGLQRPQLESSDASDFDQQPEEVPENLQPGSALAHPSIPERNQ